MELTNAVRLAVVVLMLAISGHWVGRLAATHSPIPAVPKLSLPPAHVDLTSLSSTTETDTSSDGYIGSHDRILP